MSFFSVIPAFKAHHGPLYIQLERILREAILDGSLTQSEPLPTERELAERYNISRITVRKALTDLQREGLLTRRRGAGTFVAPREERRFSGLPSFSADVLAGGRTTHSAWVEREIDGVSADESMQLGLAPGAQVHRLKRLRYTDDTPVAIELSVVPHYCTLGELDADESLYAALQAGGTPVVRALQRLRAVALTPEEAELLKVEAGSPGLYVERRGFLRDGRTAELTRAWYRGDASDLIAEIAVPQA
ncbi:MAG: GntR family transcriptional regulator [Asticcacaulis sp.]|uniref:GntR family transcriptional regulator n=1 Tax=Asticcacaulis sp. TaxID=1872648 RepID=UPI0039E45E08